MINSHVLELFQRDTVLAEHPVKSGLHQIDPCWDRHE
jgi:hypothetical protein